MIPPAVAEEARRALIAWRHLQAKNGQSVPDGWPALVELLAAYARTAPPTPDLLTLDEAAAYTRTSKSTLYRWRREGLPERHVRGRVLLARTDLDRWVRSSVGQSSVRSGQSLAGAPDAWNGRSGQEPTARAGPQ